MLIGLVAALAMSMASAAASTPSPGITLSTGSAAPNSHITVVGTGFPPNEIVGLYLDTPDLFVDVPGPRADAQGNFARSIAVPLVTPGKHQLCADTGYPGNPQQTPAKVCVPLTVQALAKSPSPTPIGHPTGASLTEILIAVVIGLAIIIGVALSMRSSK